MDLLPTAILECFRVKPFLLKDSRGSFFKTFNKNEFFQLGLATEWPEQYFSISQRGVIRGMHFQTPPYAHEKLVFCLKGKVLDVVLDLRRESSTYGCVSAMELDGSQGDGVYIPKGLAHGFATLSEEAMMGYLTTTVHSPEYDCGIHWASIDVDWRVKNPIVSLRDGKHPPLDQFNSPF